MMASKIKVDKVVAGAIDSSFTVPLLLLNLIIQLLPAPGMSELHRRGIDLCAIRNAVEQGVSYSSFFEITEDGVQKTIVISVS